MIFDAWQTVWICVGLSIGMLLLDAWFAHKSGADKTEAARAAQRDNRMARSGKRNIQ